MDITVQINSFCPAGGHINLTLVTPEGNLPHTWHKTDFQLEPDDIKREMYIALKYFIKKRLAAGKTWAEIKADIEAEVFKI